MKRSAKVQRAIGGPKKSPRIRHDLLENRRWHLATIREGKGMIKAACLARCSSALVTHWRHMLGIVGPRYTGFPSMLSPRARRTYAKRAWFASRIYRYTSLRAMKQGEPSLQRVSLHTLRHWRQRHGFRGPLPKPYPRFTRTTLFSRKWMAARVLQGLTDRMIMRAVNRLAARNRSGWRCTLAEIARARVQLRLPTPADIAARKIVRLRHDFWKWLCAHRPAWAILTKPEQRVLRLVYTHAALRENGAAIARKLGCTRMNVSAVRRIALRRIQAVAAIPRRFWPVTIRLRIRRDRREGPRRLFLSACVKNTGVNL